MSCLVDLQLTDSMRQAVLVASILLLLLQQQTEVPFLFNDVLSACLQANFLTALLFLLYQFLVHMNKSKVILRDMPSIFFMNWEKVARSLVFLLILPDSSYFSGLLLAIAHCWNSSIIVPSKK